MPKPVGIFIDGEYLRHATASEFGRVDIDLGKLARVMSGEGEILRTYYYACLPYRSRQPSAEET